MSLLSDIIENRENEDVSVKCIKFEFVIERVTDSEIPSVHTSLLYSLLFSSKKTPKIKTYA